MSNTASYGGAIYIYDATWEEYIEENTIENCGAYPPLNNLSI